ncbi:MAG: hypothetical protein AAFU56_07690 [Pseudomonadota bacterium]
MGSAAIQARIKKGLERGAIRTSDKKLEALIVRPGVLDESTAPPTLGATTAFIFTALQSQFSFVERQGGNVQSGDVKILLESGPVEPRNDDKIKVSGTLYEIEQLDAVAPGGVPLMWKVHARGGVPDSTTYLAGAPLDDTGSGGTTLLYPYSLGVPDLIDETEADFFYWGWEDATATWIVRRIDVDDSTFDEASFATDSQYADLNAAWAQRQTLTFN